MPPNQFSQSTYEGSLVKQGDLHWAVLRHLQDHGAKSWTFLYVQFDPGKTGEIGSALRDLIEWNCIDIGPTNMVEITALGMEQLQSA